MIGAELKGLWGDAIKWAAYTKNRIPHESLTGMTPTEVLLLKEVPTRSNLRTFGQRVMIHVYKDQRDGRWALLRGYKQYTYIKLYKNNRYLQYLLEYVPHSSGYNN